MTETDRSGFYTGFVADHYDLLVPEDEGGSYVFFENAIREAGGPALELACGTGRPILAFRSKGLDVEGIDSSADMLERCRRKAREMGVEVALHEQRMDEAAMEMANLNLAVANPAHAPHSPGDGDGLNEAEEHGQHGRSSKYNKLGKLSPRASSGVDAGGGPCGLAS